MIIIGILKRFKLLFLVFCCCIGQSNAQCEQVYFKGKVEDSLRPQSFYNLLVVNRNSGKAAFGLPDGRFSGYALPFDTIALSVKQYPIYEFIAQPDSNCQCQILAYIDRLPQEVAEVVVKPLKTLEQIREERANLAMRETRLVTGVNLLESPITALYQAFSKKEQNKRWIAEQVFKDNQRKVVQELLRLYVAYDIIDLKEEDFDAFLLFLNLDPDFLKTASEMELITYIKDKYEHFKRFNAGE
ncbi:MAG: hypothetical protein EB023_01435 [Flavobacteriia bacterium]|nr:hypothetical protein [Flavobacteriia bacterium]